MDDGSTDDSRAVIERFGGNIMAIFTANEGQGAAMNRGFAASRGAVVIFLDADDVLADDTGGRVIAAISDDPTIVRVQFVLDVIDGAGRPTGETVPPAPKVLFTGDARPRLLTCPDDIVWQPTSGNAFSRVRTERRVAHARGAFPPVQRLLPLQPRASVRDRPCAGGQRRRLPGPRRQLVLCRPRKSGPIANQHPADQRDSPVPHRSITSAGSQWSTGRSFCRAIGVVGGQSDAVVPTRPRTTPDRR